MSEPAICRVRLEHKDQARWLALALSFTDGFGEGRFLVYSAHFACAVDSLDELASSYTLENWESGLMSGAFFAFRQLKMPPSRLLISELRGRLSSEDMDAVAHASAAGIMRLFGREESTLGTVSEWNQTVEVLSSHAERTPHPINGGGQHNAKTQGSGDAEEELYEQLESQKRAYYESFVS